jgi:hypothetical protein
MKPRWGWGISLLKGCYKAPGGLSLNDLKITLTLGLRVYIEVVFTLLSGDKPR